MGSLQLGLLEREARADTTPGECGDQFDRFGAGYRTVLGQPESRADLAHSDETDSEQAGPFLTESGVRRDGTGDRVHAFRRRPFHSVLYGRLATQVRFEHHAERPGITVDEVEECADGGTDPEFVVGRRFQRSTNAVHQVVD